MEDRFDRLETILVALREELSGGFAAVDERFAGVDARLGGVNERLAGVDARLGGVNERLAGVDERFAGVDEQFISLRDAIRQGDEDTRSQLKAEIDSLRDDIRIFAEAHLSLEKRVTTLERHPR